MIAVLALGAGALFSVAVRSRCAGVRLDLVRAGDGCEVRVLNSGRVDFEVVGLRTRGSPGRLYPRWSRLPIPLRVGASVPVYGVRPGAAEVDAVVLLEFRVSGEQGPARQRELEMRAECGSSR